MGARLGGSFVALLIGLSVVGFAAPAEAGIIGELPDDTGCFSRSLASGSVNRVNDNTNGPLPPDDPLLYPAPDAETGNYLHRSDIFTLGECSYAELYGLNILVKNPFDIEGPDEINGTTGPQLVSVLEEDFPEFDHYTGIAITPEEGFERNPAGFHGVTACAFFGSDVGQAGNMQACIDAVFDDDDDDGVLNVPLFDLGALDPNVGPGMVFSLPLGFAGGEDDFVAICDPIESEGDCEGTSFEVAILIFSDVYGDTSGVVAHPEVMIGYNFALAPTSVMPVPEPSVLWLLGSGLAALAFRRRG